MARYLGANAFKNPNEGDYNFSTQLFTRSSNLVEDGNGRVTSVTYGDSILTNITYDSENKITSYREYIGNSYYTFTITYDASGNVTSITRV